MPAKKNIEEPEFNPVIKTNETVQSAEQINIPEQSDIDINELLEIMDNNPEDDEYQGEIENEEIDFDRYNSDYVEIPDKMEAIADTIVDALVGDEFAENSVTEFNDSTDLLPEKPKKKEQESDSKNPEKSLSANTPSVQTIRNPASRRATASILTIDAKSKIESQKNIEEAEWHEIRNAYRTRKILKGTLSGIEKTETGKTIAIVDYYNYRVVIPMKEMLINITRNPSGPEYDDFILHQNKILSTMLGAEIDFIVKGIETKTRSIVASRKDAMFKKREKFYMQTDDAGIHLIYEGSVVQARVIAVAEKLIRIEAFGAECSILAKDLSWDWIGDAHERFSIGDEILVRILTIKKNSLEDLSIKADVKSASNSTVHENLKKCRIQGKYAGTVTDRHKGAVYIRLANGANAVAHSCYDRRTPGKKDKVSFVVTHIDEERGVAFGILTNILKQVL